MTVPFLDVYSKAQVDALIGAAVSTVGPGMVLVSSFSTTRSGWTTGDDAQLENAIRFAQVQTNVPWVVIDRNLTLTATHLIDFDGYKIVGAAVGGWSGVERSSGKAAPIVITVNCGNGSSSLFNLTSTRFYCNFQNLGFRSSNGTSQLFNSDLNASGNAFVFNFHNISTDGFYGVLGNGTTGFSQTCCTYTGQWVHTNILGTQWNLQGSDSEFYGEFNIGPATGITSTSSQYWGAGQYIIELNSLGKTNISGMYLTADSGWRPLRVRGSLTFTKGLTISRSRFEGRNINGPSLGELVKVENGDVLIRDSWFGYGLGNPAAGSAAGFPTAPPGIMWQTGGMLTSDGNTYERGHTVTGTGATVNGAFVAEATPFLYSSAGTYSITNQRVAGGTGNGGSAWSAQGQARRSGTGTALVTDASTIFV